MVVEDDNKPRPEGDPAPVSTLPEAEESSPMAALLTALEQEKAALYDQLLRKQAEFDNFRKRTEREKKDSYTNASMDVVHALLPVLDALDRAVNAPTPSGEEGDPGRELRKGVELIYKQLQETLGKLGLTRIETCGLKFDPHLHHAVEMVESDEHEDQSILEEYQCGYFFRDRLLRPAMVRVASQPNRS